MKLKINLFDSNFSHHPNNSSISSFPGGEVHSKYIEWVRDPNFESDISVLTDNCLMKVNHCKSKKKIAWLIEPRILCPNIYQDILRVQGYYDCIFTHDIQLMKELNKSTYFEVLPLFGCWIKEEDFKVYDKTKNLSIIASGKTQTPLHRFRHEVISNFSNKIDGIFGNGYQRLNYKLDGLKDYRFQIVIENDEDNFFITEKIVDCMATGTIPIYRGSKAIGNWFDINGILTFKTIEDLKGIIDNYVNEEYYKSKIASVYSNLIRAKNYRVLEDYMFEKYLYRYD